MPAITPPAGPDRIVVTARSAPPWNDATPWNGWWGANPPFHHRVFVLTHHPRDPLILEGGTTFTFVTGQFNLTSPASIIAEERRHCANTS